nr:hypothetical protein [Planctomycetota bacterium]
MGFLEDLIVMVKESVEEAKSQQAQPQRPTAPVLPQVRERQMRAEPLTQRVVVQAAPAAARQPPR